MSSTLLIFDYLITQKNLNSFTDNVEEFAVFPLLSDWGIIHDVQKMCSARYGKIVCSQLLNSAEMINKEMIKIRPYISQWSADLGNRKIGDQTVKGWLRNDPEGISSWWYSLLSEKNPFKTDLFLKVAQFHAIIFLIQAGKYEKCFICVKDRELLAVLKQYASQADFSISFEEQSYGKIQKIKIFFGKLIPVTTVFKEIVSALLWLFIFFIRALSARIILGSLTKRQINESTVFVSYFPSVDIAALREGRFLNKYTIPIQGKLNQVGQKIIWMFLYVKIDGWSFVDAIKISHKIKKVGEKVFLLHEFFSFCSLVKVLKIWVRQLIQYRKISGSLTAEHLTDGFTFTEAFPLILPLLRRSFIGRNAMEGLIYFEIFKNMFGYVKTSSTCVYYAEMQAWERALNAAKKLSSTNMQAIGFQHTSLSENYFHYFFAPSEHVVDNVNESLPLPDIFAANGKIPYTLLSESNYPNLVVLESVRQLYLNKMIDSFKPDSTKRMVILIAGTIFYNETKALISMIMQAFPDKDRPFEIWLRGHPSMSVVDVLHSMGIEEQDINFKVMEKEGQSIYDLLSQVPVVITATSTIGIEALAFGCDVIIPVFADFLCMSPLIGFEALYNTVYTPQDLVEKIAFIFSDNYKSIPLHEKLTFIKNYWSLDPSLNGWRNVLGIK